MPVNPGYEYVNAEKAYLEAKTLDERIFRLEEMIRTAPKHKSSENLLAGLKLRLKKFKAQQEKSKKSSGGKKGIRKEGFQFTLVGPTNAGKSVLLSKLTNAHPKIDSYEFTTKYPEIGTLDYEGVKAQIVDLPSIGSENFDSGISNTSDCLIIVVDKLDSLPLVEPYITRAIGKRIIVVNKSDLLTEEEKRKLGEKIRSKKLNAIMVSSITGENINILKEKMLSNMNVIRVYTKEPSKPSTNIPVVLPINSNVKDVAESIRKGFSSTIKETRVTGPSSKFPNQKIGLSHILKDKDIVEFHTK